jgi:flagellar hook-length control protein FliK
MGDPRNVAHAKKVSQEKHHKSDAHSPSPAKKKRAVESSAVKPADAAKPNQKPDPTQLEKSLALLAKLKELEFHSRANIEKLAELSLTIEDELKQKAFVESIGDVYSAEEAFHSKISTLIEAYQAECDRLKPTA